VRTNNKTFSNSAVNATATATTNTPTPERRVRATLIAATVSAGAAVLTVDLGGGVTFTMDVTPGGPVLLTPEGGFQAQAGGTPISASLSAAGVGNTGRVTVTAVQE
jgi:hypothetical protein